MTEIGWKYQACLQAGTIYCPDIDRMIAEYILIKNDPKLYWKTARIFYTNTYETLSIIKIVACSLTGSGLLLFLISKIAQHLG